MFYAREADMCIFVCMCAVLVYMCGVHALCHAYVACMYILCVLCMYYEACIYVCGVCLFICESIWSLQM